MQKPVIDLSRKGQVQIPSFLLDYTVNVDNLLELKRSISEMFAEYVKTDLYKEKCQDSDFTPDIHQSLQYLFDQMFYAQKGGEIEISLLVNQN
jgi:hypothetical protein